MSSPQLPEPKKEPRCGHHNDVVLTDLGGELGLRCPHCFPEMFGKDFDPRDTQIKQLQADLKALRSNYDAVKTENETLTTEVRFLRGELGKVSGDRVSMIAQEWGNLLDDDG